MSDDFKEFVRQHSKQNPKQRPHTPAAIKNQRSFATCAGVLCLLFVVIVLIEPSSLILVIPISLLGFFLYSVREWMG